MQPETLINLVAGGALAAFLAKLLQAQYEARIADYKERIKEQSGLLTDMTGAVDKVDDRLTTLTVKVDERLGALTTKVDRVAERLVDWPEPFTRAERGD